MNAKLQLALDDVSLENALDLLDQVQACVDIVEIGTPEQIMDHPQHDYTKLLLDAVLYTK